MTLLTRKASCVGYGGSPTKTQAACGSMPVAARATGVPPLKGGGIFAIFIRIRILWLCWFFVL